MAVRRRRVGVALLLDPPIAREVQGLRRALGDPALELIAPHLTLVPPVNIREDNVPAALRTLRVAAAAQDGPLVLELGPPATFAPASPVVYLGARGSSPRQLERLGALRNALLSGPFDRPPRWPWAPHVTICDEAGPERLAGAGEILRSFRKEVTFDRVVVLEEASRAWAPFADACFGPPLVAGRGGLELEITRGRELGPEALALIGVPPGWPRRGAPGRSLVLMGRRRAPTEQAVGAAAAWCGHNPGGEVQITVAVAPGERGQGTGRALLRALESSLQEQGWEIGGAVAHGPPEFFDHCSGWAAYRPGAAAPFWQPQE